MNVPRLFLHRNGAGLLRSNLPRLPTPLRQTQRTISWSAISPLQKKYHAPERPYDPIYMAEYNKELQRLEKQVRRNQYVWLFISVVGGFASTLVLRWQLKHAAQAEPRTETQALNGGGAGVTIQDSEHVELVPTGTSSVPHFPATIELPLDKLTKSKALPSGIGKSLEDFQLMGLGIRKVSFLGIQVYVVGMYVSSSDANNLQAAFIKHSGAGENVSALVANEKDELKKRLLDADTSEEIWDDILKKSHTSLVLRIVPTRNTDFSHLRDGWIRSITARSNKNGKEKEYADDAFGEAIAEFKALFSGAGRKGVSKGRALLLERNSEGALTAWAEEKDGSLVKMGGLADERISRLVWLGYVAGSSPASEEARQNIVNGVIQMVERPIGTVETQVV